MQYSFLEEYTITQDKIDKAIKEKSMRKLRHMFYPLSAADINVGVQSFDPFPVELKTFYEEIGFGNFHCNKEYVNCLLDPHSLIHINKNKDNIIKEWEKQTAQKWPTYDEVILDKNGNVYRKVGDKYDAHHVIENNYGGDDAWWNIHPAKSPSQHQGGLHGKGAPANDVFR